MKINERKLTIRIVELMVIIATIIVTKISIDYATTLRGYVAYGGEYLIPVIGIVLLQIIDEQKN